MSQYPLRRHRTSRWIATGVIALALSPVAAPAAAAGGYQAAHWVCGFADSRIKESSGVASASWGDDVIWTHNDSGDSPRFFAVRTTAGCAGAGVYDVTGAGAVDWEDMARAGTTLYFGDIGDNGRSRRSITVYEVPEPGQGAPSGAVAATAARVLTYPDGPHDAESLLIDPTTGRIVIVTKSGGPMAAYRAPATGGGVLEKVAEIGIPAGVTTGADATADRIVVRTYQQAFEWDVRPGDTLAAVLGRPPVPVVLPPTPQGEAIAYARDGSGLWTTSELQIGGGPVHFLAAPAEEPLPVVPELPRPVLGVLSAGVAVLLATGLRGRRWARRRRRSSPGPTPDPSSHR